jgi:FlaA1/EpsC-like NDP-sugar epimerase
MTRGSWVSALGRDQKRTIILIYDGTAMLLSLWAAFSIRYGHLHIFYRPSVMLLCSATVVLGLAVLATLRIYRLVIRYFDIHSAQRLLLGAGAATSVWFMLAFVSRIESLPRSVGFIYFGLLFLLMFFGRLAASQYLTASRPLIGGGKAGAARTKIGVAIRGANSAGSSLAEALRRHPEYELRFFFDDNVALVGRTMFGVPIRSLDELEGAVADGSVERVFVALHSSTRAERMASLSDLAGLPVPVLTIPSHEEIMSGRYTLSDTRRVKVDDLLNRDIVPAVLPSVEQGIKDRNVLVTGAGGSIGSEICRQLLRHRPSRLVLFDHSEYALYTIEAELRQHASDMAGSALDGAMVPELVPIIGTLLNRPLVSDLLVQHRVDTVFHAAAYKHVPLLEHNEVTGVENNVVGTRILADACVEAGVAQLTMISTDKAVRPTNVMGSSKRLAELYIQALAAAPDIPTRFGIVRFGNVLDSSGSVVQTFRDQIRRGGPITVTHPDITRFFMSIPEATQLVLQANSWARGGEVFVLDMGEPVRIAELARTMITLSGMIERNADNPDGDIEIVYVGLRPGEKLHEELFIGEDITDTPHPQIKMARERLLPMRELRPLLSRLECAIRDRDRERVRAILTHIIEEDHRLVA